MQSANPSSQMLSLQAEENRRVNLENHQLRDTSQKQASTIQQLQKLLKDKEEQLAIETSDKVRFKELSENYMTAVARLESQLEAVKIKPLSKLSQRPKDTVIKDQTNSLTNAAAQRLKTVEPKQLGEVVLHLKLLLQQQQLPCNSISSMEALLFGR